METSFTEKAEESCSVLHLKAKGPIPKLLGGTREEVLGSSEAGQPSPFLPADPQTKSP